LRLAGRIEIMEIASVPSFAYTLEITPSNKKPIAIMRPCFASAIVAAEKKLGGQIRKIKAVLLEIFDPLMFVVDNEHNYVSRLMAFARFKVMRKIQQQHCPKNPNVD
jgi:hypothetical protein